MDEALAGHGVAHPITLARLDDVALDPLRRHPQAEGQAMKKAACHTIHTNAPQDAKDKISRPQRAMIASQK
ncbi:hypothetical protein [Brevundimonas sp.]|uniref:hypothetical protein n=1 Tax=Brevundimonas sp. TaxID=1871086 RepID=UPI0035AF846B